MAIGIDWNDVVGDKTILAGGYVGDLLTVARAHITDALNNNHITQAQAGEIYTAMIPSAFQNGIGFEVEQEKVALSKIPSTLK